jgi:hypothetical protein
VKFVVIAPNGRTSGETGLGLQIARELRAGGHGVQFVVPAQPAVVEKVKKQGFSGQLFGPRPTPAASLREAVDQIVARESPDALILADYMLTALILASAGGSESLLRHRRPVVAIDPWDLGITGFSIDNSDGSTVNIPNWLDLLACRLTPVPVTRPDGPPGSYAALPQIRAKRPSARPEILRSLGLGADDRLLLFPSSSWQHADVGMPNIVSLIPALLALYLGRLGRNVHLLHIGPSPCEIRTPNYRWMGNIDADMFERLLVSVDAVIAPNAASATLVSAAAAGVPAIALVNSMSLLTEDDVAARAPTWSPEFRRVVAAAIPVRPFLMWPIGWSAFLAPLMSGNPCKLVIEHLELLDELSVIVRLEKILFGGHDEVWERRAARYRRMIEELPTATEALSKAGLVSRTVSDGPP